MRRSLQQINSDLFISPALLSKFRCIAFSTPGTKPSGLTFFATLPSNREMRRLLSSRLASLGLSPEEHHAEEMCFSATGGQEQGPCE
ncbi:unnamed protein product [Gadus morhua 'NCC']